MFWIFGSKENISMLWDETDYFWPSMSLKNVKHSRWKTTAVVKMRENLPGVRTYKLCPRDLLSWWLPKKETCFEVRASRHSRVRCEFINDEERVFSINNIVLWSRPSNRSVALSSGLWEVVIEEALFCAITMVGSTRKGKELKLKMAWDFLCLHRSCR